MSKFRINDAVNILAVKALLVPLEPVRYRVTSRDPRMVEDLQRIVLRRLDGITDINFDGAQGLPISLQLVTISHVTGLTVVIVVVTGTRELKHVQPFVNVWKL